MAKLYKLTRLDFTTYESCLWGEDVTHETDGSGELCSKGWLHAYTDPRLAVIFSPIHADYNPCILWECEGIIGKNDRGLKVGTTKLTTIKQINLPVMSIDQKIEFAICCVLEVYRDTSFTKWAKEWINGTDRTQRSAYAAAADAYAADAAYAAYAAAYAAADAADDAADDAAAYAADDADDADADAAADAAYAAYAAVDAAYAAADAAYAAAYAAAAYAAYAADAADDAAAYAVIDFIKIIDQIMNKE